MRRCFRSYKSDQGIAQFKRSLGNQDYDLRKWRETVEGNSGFEEGLRLLDDYGGFSLLEACFRKNPNLRISSEAAASSRFCRFA